MKVRNIHIVKMALVLLWFCLISGCASHFQAIETPEGMGVIHFYRPKKCFDSVPNFDIHANGFKLDKLRNGRYFTHIAKPGRIQFYARNEVTSYVTLDVKSGQTYYVRGTTKPGVVTPRPCLQLVAPEIGEHEIVSLRANGRDKNRDEAQVPRPDTSEGE